jgi:hypothetical protein
LDETTQRGRNVRVQGGKCRVGEAAKASHDEKSLAVVGETEVVWRNKPTPSSFSSERGPAHNHFATHVPPIGVGARRLVLSAAYLVPELLQAISNDLPRATTIMSAEVPDVLQNHESRPTMLKDV